MLICKWNKSCLTEIHYILQNFRLLQNYYLTLWLNFICSLFLIYPNCTSNTIFFTKKIFIPICNMITEVNISDNFFKLTVTIYIHLTIIWNHIDTIYTIYYFNENNSILISKKIKITLQYIKLSVLDIISVSE